MRPEYRQAAYRLTRERELLKNTTLFTIPIILNREINYMCKI